MTTRPFFGPLIEANQERGIPFAGLATDCLLRLDELPADDLARPDVAAGAVAFAMLAVADALKATNHKWSVADAVLESHGIQS